MSLRSLPEAPTMARRRNYQWDAPSDVLAKWAETAPMAAAEDDRSISILDVIGEEPWSGGGVTAKRISAALRSIGSQDIVVRINSPGGDMFEGIAIYNLLCAHPAKVTVEVLGWAASAASIIAMAGDEIRMGHGAFMMVHNAWGMVIGNRHDMREAASLFDQFDAAIADIYEARTGMTHASIEQLMDAETFMDPAQAIEYGFADAVDDAEIHTVTNARAQARPEILAKRRIDAALAQHGIPRTERRKMFNQIAGTHNAAEPAMHDAGFDIAAMQRLIETIRS
ncbi:head maturation protease, ClpP-related [Chelativorans sp. Marseille-P2723]|uniref:head maturation protease, ClpP-related n=1 Tax=Chelativorans sp. Marseille-P2723 TaxID=2709133 RepID=UPI001570CA9A|nr:head maturation protease, ClpP-related [Chelativorans sp. Marseille-P2723]